ncbi:MAG TPA: hypothetical protein VKA46_12195 [Gemmataceae bacterium]|nr:hypothetical protein [Gemmataceae bacterium]
MDPETAACPYCTKVIEPRPRRNRKCPHCREPVVLRKGILLTTAGAQALDQKKAAPDGGPAPAEEAPCFARFKMFRSSLTTWESLFAEAAEFVTELGPERLITVSHSSDNGEGVVAVWYWESPEWGGVGAPPPEASENPA